MSSATRTPEISGASRRLRGAYYTPQSVAEFIAEWAVRWDGEHVLEPSFGDGMFLRAVGQSIGRRNLDGVRVSGVEIDAQARDLALRDGAIAGAELRLGDFLDVEPFAVQAVIGNPPYVRLRRLAPADRERALLGAQVGMGALMDPSGSLWMPFVLHAMRFLDRGGRLAFVLPYDFTYVRYARPLWRVLAERFGAIRVLRTHERAFPDILQDVIILLADDFGGCTKAVHYQAFNRVADLLGGNPVADEQLAVRDIASGDRAFISALLRPELRELLRRRVVPLTAPARESVTFNIGYVAGDKTFFHPDADHVHAYALPSRNLRPALTSTRAIRRAGLWSSAIGD